MDSLFPAVYRTQWITLEEARKLYPKREEIGFHDSVRLLRSGERVSPTADELRRNMKIVRDKQGKLIGMTPIRGS